jgi:phosphoglycolate phosphatase-like HAD superfamily hydrolase
MDIAAIFIDDGGVMNDNALRGAQWQRLVAEFFVPRLGGDEPAWMEANRRFVDRMVPVWMERQAGIGVPDDFEAMVRDYAIDWMRSMCVDVGVACPDDDECVGLSRQAGDFVIPRVRAAFPGAPEAVRALRLQGRWVLHTASGEASYELDGYLRGMGIREHFTTLYGPDLVVAVKGSDHYYPRVFADAGLAPGAAVVVDDSPAALGKAAEAGARTVLVRPGAAPGGFDAVISRLAELPALLETQAWR